MHAVMDALSGPSVLARRYGGLEIDDTRIWPYALELRQSIAPNIGEIDRLLDRPHHALRQFDVVQRRTHVRLEQLRFARMRQNLVNTSASHDIATHKQRDSR